MRIRTISLVVLLGLAIALFGCGGLSENEKDEKKLLLNLEREFLDKEFKLDTAYLSSLIDSTFIDIGASEIKKKKEDLVSIYNNIDQRIKRGIVVDSFKIENEVINVYSNSAVVTFIVHSYRHSSDSLIERRTRFYDVWIKRDNRWKLVASQGTLIQNTN